MGTGTLGAAVYELVFDTRQVAKMTAAEGKVVAATDGMEVATVRADTAVMKLASDTGLAAGRISASYKEAGAGAQVGADEISTAANKAGVAGGRAAMGAAKAESAWLRFGKIGGGMGQMLGLGAAYFAIKGGFEWMKGAQAGVLAVNQTLKATGNVAGVTMGTVNKLSDTFTKWTGDSRGANLQLLQLLLTFKNVRNVGQGNLAVFDRSAKLIEDIAVGTHRSTRMIAIAMGKVMNDPANNLNSLGRAGIRFNKVQQQMVKDIQAGKIAFQGQKGVVGAQLYVFSQLSAWTGKAAAQQNSLTTKLHVAKDAIDAASAKIITALLPAFIQIIHVIEQVATVISHHTTLLKDLVVAYLALKAAAVATRIAMALFRTVIAAVRLAQLGLLVVTGRLNIATALSLLRQRALTVGFGRAALGAQAAATAEAELAVAETEAGAAAGVAAVGLTAMLGPIALVVAAVVGLVFAWREWKKLSNQIVNAPKAIGTDQRQGNQFYAQRVKAYEKAGMSPLQAKTQADAATRKLYPNWSHAGKGPDATGGAYGAKPAVIPGLPPKSGKGAGLLPIQMQIDLAIAQRQGAGAQIAVLKKEQSYLYGLLKKTHDPAKVLAIQQELTNVWSNMTGLEAGLNKKKKGGYHGLVPISMALAYQKALQTKGLGDDIKVLKQEESYFQKLLKNHKLSGAKQLAVMTELTRVKKKLAEDLKKQAALQDAAKHAFDVQMQAYVDTRGSFFSQFASSVFGGSPGALTMGAGAAGSTKTYNQENHFHEIPKDRYALSRQMQGAAASSM
jgi:hypothetical protein